GIEDPWPYPFPADTVAPSLAVGEVYLAFRGGPTAVATVNLSWEDPRFWGEQPPVAGYAHRLAVRRRFAGTGVGATLLSWADGEIRKRARSFLRLDCLARNRRLCSYYEALGFAPRGIIEVAGVVCARFERRVRSVAPEES
ncbi:MAG: GNAT family N-acetyltransferase, partial [Thermoplasmata archaeon]|nr:GNAT family N-acetyltransferase [Thermoplasmata archaeon]